MFIKLKTIDRSVWINPKTITTVEVDESIDWVYIEGTTRVNFCDGNYIIIAGHPDEVIEKIINLMKNT